MPETQLTPNRREIMGAGAVVAAAAAALAIVALTGGGSQSAYLPLLCLPIVLAAATCRSNVVVWTGVLVACGQLAIDRIIRHSGADREEWTRALTWVAAAWTAALVARRGISGASSESLSTSEREGLLGLAYTDPMTGLYNFRKFRNTLEEELRRAARYGHALSLILVDLDGFKSVNDRYGHPAGDRVLTRAGEIIRSTLRETDLPARYGGEEFVVVCPETNSEEAMRVAERIRRAIQEARHELLPGDECTITCSAGIATFPDHARDEVGLIDTADAALYRAKDHGKNRVDLPHSSHTKT